MRWWYGTKRSEVAIAPDKEDPEVEIVPFGMGSLDSVSSSTTGIVQSGSHLLGKIRSRCYESLPSFWRSSTEGSAALSV